MNISVLIMIFIATSGFTMAALADDGQAQEVQQFLQDEQKKLENERCGYARSPEEYHESSMLGILRESVEVSRKPLENYAADCVITRSLREA